MADMRRIAGIAMIVLAGVGVGAATTLRQQVTGGSAAAIAIPAPPQVGDCVLDGAELPQRVSSGTPTFGYGPCVGARAGEVVSVVADPWVDPGAKDSHTAMRDGSPSDAIAAQCAQDARVYAGLAAAPPTIDPAAGGVSFSPSIWLPVSALFPDDRQRAVGQDWVACVVESPTDTTFAGSVRAVFARQQPSGTLPAAFARCLVEANATTAGDCDVPHQVELLGFRLVKDTPDAARLARSACTDFAATVLKRPDPTAGGALEVVSIYDRSTHEATCQIASAGPRLLRGSLIGLGDRPIPWAA